MSNKPIIVLCIIQLLVLSVDAATDQYDINLIIPVNATPTPTPTPSTQSSTTTGGGGGFGSSTVSQNPPEVSIQLVDLTPPDIEIGLIIRNEGLYPYEYTYAWKLYKYDGLVATEINNGMSSKYLKSGEYSTIPLTLDLQEGTYEIAVDVTWGIYKSSAKTKFEVTSLLSGSQKRVTKFINSNIIIVLIILIVIFGASLYFVKVKR